MNRIKYSPEAIIDLQSIKRYILEELESAEHAQDTIGKIVSKIKKLADFPMMGPKLSSVVDFDSTYRFLVCGNYTTFYLLENNEVCIIRILYGRRDFMRILFNDVTEKSNNN